ncbi:MAG: cytochrome c [Acidobacteriia bacterium]|nr:cytochrome c [Terriglobia bacterium]
MIATRALMLVATLGLIGAAASVPAQTATSKAPAAAKAPSTFGIGRPATAEDIARVNIDIHPDGTGLPAGSATSADGAPIYAAKCASCHGKTGKEGPNDRLVGRVPGDGFPFARDPRIPHTIGSYWPYATTVFDYIRRAMPPTEPGSLRDTDVYALTAYLLFLNDLIPADAAIDATSLPKVKMPSRDRFVPDPRGGPTPATPKGSRGGGAGR